MSQNVLIDAFTKYFYVVNAADNGLRDKAFNIRYQVYCQEFKFEPEDKFPDQKERDEYDQVAHHCLIIHKPSNTAVGCIRLIVTDNNNPIPLPFVEHCIQAVDPNIIDITQLDRYCYGEISRLAVIHEFRRRKSDDNLPFSMSIDESEGGRRFPYPIISIGLILSIFSVIINYGYQYGFCMMEPRLAAMLESRTLVFEKIGDAINYHGYRGPYMIHRDNIKINLDSQVLELYEVINDQLFPNTGNG